MACAAKPFLSTCLVSSSPAIFTAGKTTNQHILRLLPLKPIHLSTSISLPTRNHPNLSRIVTFVTSQEEEKQPSSSSSSVDEEEEELIENQELETEYREPPEDAKIFVGNLPYDVDSEQLAQLFQQAGVVEISEVIYNRETDQSRGFGFVTMSSVEEADKAVEMLHRYEVGGRYLTVNKAAPKGSRPPEQPQPRGPSYRVYVGNLPWDVDDVRLEQLFSEHGKVVNARVVYDRETGRSRGFAFVTMSSHTELNDAIQNLDGQSLGGRAIRVNVAEEKPPRRF